MYDFEPMLPVWRKICAAPRGWAESSEGRRLIARAIRHCRNTYGREEGRRFYDAVTVAAALSMF